MEKQTKKSDDCDVQVTILEDRLFSACKEDVDSLAKAFISLGVLDFSNFVQLFHQREFGLIFLGRLSLTEFVEFSEMLLQYCARYIFVGQSCRKSVPRYVLKKHPEVTPSCTDDRLLSERIFGVFVLYCLYYLQPTDQVSLIRLSVLQMEHLYKFTTEMLLPNQRFDAVFCLFRLFQDNAFAVKPFENEYNLLLFRRYDFSPTDGSTAEEIDEVEDGSSDFPHLKALCRDETLAHAASIHTMYSNLRDEIRARHSDKEEIAGLVHVDIVDMPSKAKELLCMAEAIYQEETSKPQPIKSEAQRQGARRSRLSQLKQEAFESFTVPKYRRV